MNINPLIESALTPLNIPVNCLRYAGTADTYITYYTVSDSGAFYADDECLYDEVSCTIDLFSKTNYKSLLASIKTQLKAAGFDVSQGPEQYEDSTGLYHVTVEATFVG